MKRKAILYVRVSTDEQAEKGHSLGHQEDRLRNYCLQNNIEVVAFFREDHSAKSFERPAFKQLLTFIKSNKKVADMLFFLKWDRFSRNAADAYAMINQLLRLGVEPQAMEQPLNMEIPEHKFMLAIYLAAPEVENDRRALNIIAGMRKAMKEGRWMGGAPKGYIRSRDLDNRPCIIPGKDATLIVWAFEMMATGQHHIEELRRLANKKGLKVSRNAFWCMLRNPAYIGKIIIPPYKDEELITVEGRQEPIISNGLFYEVQDVLEGKKRKDLPAHSSKRNELPLRGFLQCSKCGRNLTGSASKGNGGRYFYYHCKEGCKERFRATEANEVFYEQLADISNHQKTLLSLEIILKDVILKNSKEKSTDLNKLKQEADTYRNRLTNAQNMMLDGSLDTVDYNNIRARLEPQLNKLIRDIASSERTDPEANKIIDYGFYYFRNFDKLFLDADLEEKHRILGSTFPEKLVFENKKVRTAKDQDIMSLLLKADKRFIEIKKGRLHFFSRPSQRVELQGIEPWSKHIRRKPSTCLFSY